MASRLYARSLLTGFCTILIMACDSAPVVEQEDPVAATEEVLLEDQIVGLWERDVGSTTIGWLFKAGGIYQLGEPRPFFPVVGQWFIVGDTLNVEDPGCLDRASYRIDIGDGELSASVIDDTCGGRKTALEGTWRRFVYGE